MMFQEVSQENYLVGDLYHWELDQEGYFDIKENMNPMKCECEPISVTIEDIGD